MHFAVNCVFHSEYLLFYPKYTSSRICTTVILFTVRKKSHVLKPEILRSCRSSFLARFDDRLLKRSRHFDKTVDFLAPRAPSRSVIHRPSNYRLRVQARDFEAFQETATSKKVRKFSRYLQSHFSVSLFLLSRRENHRYNYSR